MIVKHEDHIPIVDDTTFVAANAVLCGNVKIGNRVLIGPNSHVTGCSIEDNVFIATGASVFHGAELKKGVEVRINGVVHLKTMLPENTTVPIGWIAVGNPAKILPPDKHDEIWKLQEPLNFPLSVYGVERGENAMIEIMDTMTDMLKSRLDDEVIV